MEEKVGIILVNYNTSRDTILCIESLTKVEYTNFEIVVVDNNSKEDEIDILREYLKEKEKCLLIESKENLGFAGGNNVGIKHVKEQKTKYVLLLNCDTIVEKNFLNELVYNTENDEEKIGISIGKIKYFSDKSKIWYAGGEINWNKFTGEHFDEGKIDNNSTEMKYVTFATGCMMLINLCLVTNAELSREYFMYYEDVDFCAKILDQGLKIKYIPQSVIYHKIGSASGGEESPFTVEWATRGRMIFMKKYGKNKSKISLNIIKLYFYFTRFVKFIQFLFVGEGKKAIAIYSGVRRGILYKM
ncbi:MAG: glycosyltransferase family 2 protein [Sarcina sp.]